MRHTTPLAAALLACSLAGATPPAPSPPPTQRQVAAQDLPPAMRLGARVVQVRRAIPVADAVVIVPDEASYLAALALWTPKLRFPVLIDDGTPAAAEAIARFCRAFAPKAVLQSTIADAQPLPDAPDARVAALTRVVARAWGVPAAEAPDQPAGLLARFASVGLTPPGIVLIDPKDPGRAAGVALAAAHGQPIFRFDNNAGPRGVLPTTMIEELAAAAEEAAAATKLPWNAEGDALESITLAFGITPKAEAPKPTEMVAVTDRVGRSAAGDRWGWSGQIFSTSPADAAWRAMSAIFLRPGAAWLFDGYETTEPWNAFDCTEAANVLKQAGLATETLDHPAGTEPAWRRRARTPVDAGLVFVNSMGNADFFQLFGGGQAKPADVPVLAVPAAVHFVHSWSATEASLRQTVAGRWIERGAYLYCGSVHEPYLQAFLPTPQVAVRLANGFPFAAAVRHDRAPLWKIAVIGDPLWTWGPAFGNEPARAGPETPVKGSPIADVIRERLAAKDLAGALRLLALSGRDADAADLFAAAIKDAPQLVTPAMCRDALTPLFLAGRTDALIDAFGRMDAAAQRDPVARDLLWHASGDKLQSAPDEGLLNALRAAIRDDNAARDAAELARGWARVFGRAPAADMLAQLRDRQSDPTIRGQYQAAIKAFERER